VSRDKDRWHELDDAIDASNMPASDRAVYKARLKRADYGTGDLPRQFTDKQATVARKTGVSLRQVQYAERHLERHGWFQISGTTGPGKTRRYLLTAGLNCDCTGRRHEAQRTQRAGSTDATEATNGRNLCVRTDVTNGRNAAVQRPVPTERHREGEEGGGLKAETSAVGCRWCGQHDGHPTDCPDYWWGTRPDPVPVCGWCGWPVGSVGCEVNCQEAIR
jgi:hypothetical protein